MQARTKEAAKAVAITEDSKLLMLLGKGVMVGAKTIAHGNAAVYTFPFRTTAGVFEVQIRRATAKA